MLSASNFHMGASYEILSLSTTSTMSKANLKKQPTQKMANYDTISLSTTSTMSNDDLEKKSTQKTAKKSKVSRLVERIR